MARKLCSCAVLALLLLPQIGRLAVAQSCQNGGTCVYTAPPNCKIDVIEPRLYRVFGCTAGVEAPWDGLSARTERSSCIANPPVGYVLWDIETPPVEFSNNGSKSISRMTQGLEFKYEDDVDDAYKSALDIAGHIADEKEKKDAELKINNDWARHRQIVQNVKTNQDTVRVDVVATAHGAPWDRKRGWEEVTVFLQVRCADPSDLKDQLLDKYNLRSDLAKMQQTVIFHNDTAVEKFIAWTGVDRFHPCGNPTGAVSSIGVAPGQTVQLPMDISLSVCYSASSGLQTPSTFDPSCRAKTGDTVDISAKPACNH